MYSVLCAHIIIVIRFLLERPFSASAFLMKTWIIHIHTHEEWSRLKKTNKLFHQHCQVSKYGLYVYSSAITLLSQQIFLECLFHITLLRTVLQHCWVSKYGLHTVYWSTHTLQHCWVSKHDILIKLQINQMSFPHTYVHGMPVGRDTLSLL